MAMESGEHFCPSPITTGGGGVRHVRGADDLDSSTASFNFLKKWGKGGA